MEWWQTQQFQVTLVVGILTVIISAALSAFFAGRRTRSEFRRQMRQRLREETYSPLLAGLNRFRRQMEVSPFPIAFYFSTPPGHVTYGHFDLSWWGELKDRGDHLRLDKELRHSLNVFEIGCHGYLHTRERAVEAVDRAVTYALEMANITASRFDLGQEVIEGRAINVHESAFRDGADPERANDAMRRATADLPEVQQCRRDQQALAEMVDELIEELEGRIAEVEREWR